MDNLNFAEKLRAERERLGFSQEFMANKLNITQSGYSRIESGETKLTLDRVDELSKLLEVPDSTKKLSLESEKVADPKVILISWPWGKFSLYAFGIIITSVGIEFVYGMAKDIYSGYLSGLGPNHTASDLLYVPLSALFFYAIYWLCWVKKWW
jgi:transcriptional regulator with XRE-family HTH domain